MNKAEELIACLEGEIAKRDARIVELEAAWQQATVARKDGLIEMQEKENDRLRAELSAIRAQEPVAWAATARKKGVTDQRSFWHGEAGADEWISHYVGRKCEVTKTALYAAPVSEAKAQGVVMPDRKIPSVRHGYRELGSIEGWNACLDAVARLNAAPVQQVSVPDVSAMARVLADRNADACNVNREDNWAIYGRDYIDDVTAMLDAAPAAPAADALYEALRQITREYIRTCVQLNGDKEEEMQDVTCVKAANKALAAHRSTGVA